MQKTAIFHDAKDPHKSKNQDYTPVHMKILVTGAAGFVGMHTCQRLLARGDTVLGIDNLNSYYDVALKRARLDILQPHPRFEFEQFDIANADGLSELFSRYKPKRVVHLAAQAGVRYSLVNPQAYVNSNLLGFTNILEGCRHHGVEHLVYASSSSVYGCNSKLPYSERDSTGHPVSFYAATKIANEMMAHTYSHLFGLPTTGLRFFTVYGPWGRPDMAPYLFVKAILSGEVIQVFNHGQMTRDFTYVDDIVEGLVRVVDKSATPDTRFDPAAPEPHTSNAPYRLFNIGNSTPIPLLDYIEAIEQNLGVKAIKNYLPLQQGDVISTHASTQELDAWVGFKPTTSVQKGVHQFVQWYRKYYGA